MSSQTSVRRANGSTAISDRYYARSLQHHLFAYLAAILTSYEAAEKSLDELKGLRASSEAQIGLGRRSPGRGLSPV